MVVKNKYLTFSKILILNKWWNGGVQHTFIINGELLNNVDGNNISTVTGIICLKY